MADPYENKPSIIQEIKDSVQMEGYTEGTPEFEHRKNQLHVLKCRELRGLSTCTECIAAEHCSLYAAVRAVHSSKI